MALAGRRWLLGRLPPLSHPLPVAARLLATTFLALARWPDTAAPPAAATRAVPHPLQALLQ